MSISMAGVFALGLLVASAATSWARVGETPGQIQNRFVRPEVGREFNWPRDMSEREKERQIRENPLRLIEHFLPQGGDWQEEIYWKTAERRRISPDNGWRIHVYFYRGVSAVECYRRVGQPLTEAEVNGILNLMRGNMTWKRAPRAAAGGGAGRPAAQAEDTVIGYDYELGDGETVVLRARRQGDWLVVYSKGFDDLLIQSRTAWNKTEAERRAQQKAAEEEMAPVSVDGF